MAGCSFVSYRYDVFPSFSGVDVRKTFLSHLLKALEGKSINTFIDNGIERSSPIGPSLFTAIAEARISIVIFSKNYASSTWCLNELVEIHKCYKELGQMVIPVFYNVDPSEVRKQTGDFGKFFEETCEVSKDKQPEDQKQRWMEALKIIADIAGEDLLNGSSSEAAIIEKIADDVLNKLTLSSNCFDDFAGIEEQLKEMKPLLSLESKESRMIGIWGPSGIGKSTIGKALYSRLLNQFHFHAFIPHVYRIKSKWEDKFLSEILGKDIKIGGRLGVVKQMLNKKKILVVLDNVDDPEFLKTLVGKSKWFGPGSRIIVISEDKRILDQAHDVDHLYEVKFPSQDIALKMFCQIAFGKNSPPNDFKELASEVAKLAFNLPLGLSILGLSLRKKEKKDWVKIMPRLQNDLEEIIEKQLRIRYDRLNQKDQELFLDVACFYNGYRVSYFEDFLHDNTGLKSLIDKSLVRITPQGYIEMHNFLEKLGKKIDREESKGSPEKSRFLKNPEEILTVLTHKPSFFQENKNVLGIFFKASETKKPFILIDKHAFKGMDNLQFLRIHNYSLWSSTETCIVHLPKDFYYWPRKLRWLEWNSFPLKHLPYGYNTEYLVELSMEDSKLKWLWFGTKPLGCLKTMNLSRSKYLKEIPNLSKAINLEELNLHGCISLVKLCSSIQVAIKLRKLNMRGCIKLKSFPTHLNFKSLHDLDLTFCHNLKNFPVIKMENSIFMPHEVEIRVDDCLWNRNLYETMWNSDLYGGLDYLGCLRTCLPCEFRPEYLVRLVVIGNKYIKKLWEGVQPLGSLTEIDLSECTELIEIPDLSKAINLWSLKLNYCESLVTLPSTIGNLQNLKRLEMRWCILLEVVPIDVTLLDLEILDFTGCKSLRNFPSDLMVYRKDL